MDVWRHKSGERFRREVEIASATEELRVAVDMALVLVREINVLLGVANDSSDFRTRSVRLAGAKKKLSELQTVVALHPLMRITGLAEVERNIAVIERQLVDCQSQPDTDGALWVFHAAFYLRTPLNDLLHHGLVERGPRSSLPAIASTLSHSAWRLYAPTLRDLGIDIDESPHLVASDIGPIPTHGEPFLSFLMAFRSLIESGMAPSEIEFGLNIFSGRDEFTAAVFERLGPTKKMMRRAGTIY
jgi:hypothetical protein